MMARNVLAGFAALAVLGAPALAEAEEASADASISTDDIGSGEGDDSGAFLITPKVGGIASFNGLNPFVHGGLELGYVFGGTDRTIGAYLAGEYTAQKTDGSQTEDDTPSRIADGEYDWEITQKQLVLQPTFLYRFTWLTDAVVPYAGIGPRIYLLESVVRGEAGGEKFQDTKERSTKFGFGVPLGVEVPIWKGGFLAELLFQWGPLTHTTTGDTNLGGASLFVGYRFLL